MKKFNRNYHTHCDLCKHAIGTIEDYVVKAIENGFKAIGISDHAPFDFLEERSLRMTSEEFPEYIRQLKHVIVEYLDYILIYRSLEIEYFNGMDHHYQELLEKLDYLILGQHYIEIENELRSVYKLKTYEEMEVYAKTITKAMRKGYFKIIAHPDIFLINQGQITDQMIELSKEIIKVAKETNTLLEINANGFRKRKHKIDGKLFRPYPRIEFWKVVHELNAKAIISADAHRPDQLNDQAIEQAMKFAEDIQVAVEEELVLD
jgi:histidinol-phosphatase (PHP family)